MSAQPPGLRAVCFAAFASMGSMRVCDAMLAALSAEYGVGTGDAAWVVAAFAVAYGLCQLVYGPLGDRLGKLRVVGLAASGAAVFSVLAALSASFTWLVAARAGMGAMAAGIIPLSMAWIGDQVSYERRQETLARLMGATVSGMMLGQWFGGIAADHLGWRSAFALLAVLFLLGAALLWRQQRQAAGTADGPGHADAPNPRHLPYAAQVATVLREPRARLILAVVAAEGALAFGIMSFAPSQFVRRCGVSAATAGTVVILFGVGGLAYSQFARRWLQLLGERGLAMSGGVLLAAGLVLAGWASTLAPAALGCGLAGLGFYMLHNTLQTQATQMAPGQRGTAVTLFACSLFLGQSLGVMAAGLGADRDLLDWLFTAAGLGLLALGLTVSRYTRLA